MDGNISEELRDVDVSSSDWDEDCPEIQCLI